MTIEKTTSGLRAFLFDEIEKLSSGKITPQQAGASSKLAAQILNSARIDIEHHKASIGDRTKNPVAIQHVELVSK